MMQLLTKVAFSVVVVVSHVNFWSMVWASTMTCEFFSIECHPTLKTLGESEAFKFKIQPLYETMLHLGLKGLSESRRDLLPKYKV